MPGTAEKQENYHVKPVDDWHEHEDSTTCPCNPAVTMQENGNMVITHNSFDGREHLEANHDWRNCEVCISDLETTTTDW